MILYKGFPSSPFHEDVPQILAQIETQLGDVYFKKEDYPSAWNSYNNALAREYPNSKGAHLNIYNALARTYEAGKDLSEAADMHIYILNNYASKKTTRAALAFLESNLKALEEIDGSAKQLKQMLKDKVEEEDSPDKSVARKHPKWPAMIFQKLWSTVKKF
jgi:tetratricopeptide (TPR) repeat protein